MSRSNISRSLNSSPSRISIAENRGIDDRRSRSDDQPLVGGQSVLADDGGAMLLDRVSLQVKPGETVALVSTATARRGGACGSLRAAELAGQRKVVFGRRRPA